jgi:hypothetical protein
MTASTSYAYFPCPRRQKTNRTSTSQQEKPSTQQSLEVTERSLEDTEYKYLFVQLTAIDFQPQVEMRLSGIGKSDTETAYEDAQSSL